jgi:serine/threonine-protein kinase
VPQPADERAPIHPPGLRLGAQVGRWVLDQRLGSSTWTALDPATGRRVAVRVARPSSPAAAAVRAEAAALAALGARHLPGLVRPAGEVAAAGVVAVATELVEGAPLAQAPPRPWPEVAAGLVPVADALAAVHAAGWVHGDVAPANVVGGVLVDLGCAAPAGRARATGTPGSVAPEVESGAPVTPAAEVWSLAAVAAASVAGGSAQAALALRRALADDPADRPGAAALARVLRDAAAAAVPVDPRLAVTREYRPR